MTGGQVLRPYVRRHALALGGAGAATIISTIAALAMPWPLKVVIDSLVTNAGTDTALLVALAAATIGIAGAEAIAVYLADTRLRRAGEAIAHDLRVATYGHLQRLSLGFHDGRGKGDLVTRVTADVTAVGTIFSQSLGEVTSAVLMLAGMAVVAVWLDPVLAGVMFAVLPPLAIVTHRYRRRVQTLARHQRRSEGEIASIANEALSSMRVVKAFNSEAHESQRVAERSETRRRLGVEASQVEARFAGVIDILGATILAAVLVAGALRVRAGAITPGDLVVVMAYAGRTYKPLRSLSRQTGLIARGLARAERVGEVLAADDVLRPGDGLRSTNVVGALRVEDVHFAYPDGRVALTGVTLDIAPGECVAVMGASGAGKSTLASLVARFHDPQRGRVLLDGHDLREYDLDWLRSNTGLLLQETVLFSGTIAENIAYATDATRAQVVAAAQAAGADAFIGSLPDGYDTDLGAGGSGLSGGQRQRLGIARVLLRDPAVLVLDEPTTGLDATTEATLMDSLLELARGRTTILVTHSAALAERADRIIDLSAPAPIRRARRPLPLPRPDHALGGFAEACGADGAGTIIGRTAPDLVIEDVEVREIDHTPGRTASILTAVRTAGAWHDVVLHLDTSRDLEASAAGQAARDIAELAAPRVPAAEPIAYDAGARALVEWAPADLDLPLLAEPKQWLAARAGVTADVRRVAYRPHRSAAFAIGDRFLKLYATTEAYAAAVRGLQWSTSAPIDAPAFGVDLPDARATIQEYVDGTRQLGSDAPAIAREAGAIAACIHEGAADGLSVYGPYSLLEDAATTVARVAACDVELGARAHDILARLKLAMPDLRELVPSHGDYVAGQFVRVGARLVVTDFDAVCRAPAALDLAAFAADRIGGRDGDVETMQAVLDELVVGYGARPDNLEWFLAAQIVRRAKAPFRLGKRGWPTRTAAMLAAAAALAPARSSR